MLRLLILKLLISLLYLPRSVLSNYISIDISVNNTEINTPASYTFSLVRDLNPLTSDFIIPETIPLNSVIQFVFPNDYVSVSSASTVPCTDTQTGLALICEVSDATKTVTVKNYYTTTTATGNIYPSIKVDNILNPPKSGQTGNFVYYIRSSSGVIIDQSPAATNTIYSTKLTFTPGRFTSCKLSAQSATILTRSRIVVSLSPKNPISSSGKVVLEFPLSWNNDVQSTRTVTTTPSCTAISNTASTLSCSFLVMGFPINKIFVTVTGLTATQISSAFNFSIQSVLTPPVVDSSDNVVISSQASDNSNIDTCQTVITDLTPIQFQTINFESTTNTLVQSTFIGRLSLSIAKPFSASDTIVFTVPDNFLNGVISSNGFSSFSQSRDSSSSSITLSNFPSTSSRSTGSQMNFTFSSITNPTSIKPLTVIVSFYRLGSLYQQSTISYNAIAGTATSFKILPVTSFVNARGSAQVEINTTFGIPIGGRIKISYPSTVTSANIASTTITSSALNGISVSSSQFRVASNTIIFENIFQSAFTGGIILVDFSQFQNPPTIQPSEYLLIVQTSDGFNIFTGSTVITSTLRGLIKNDISSSSPKVLENSVLTAALQLNFAATTISIIVPSDILIRTGFETTCLPNSLTACYLNGNNLTFEGNFQPGVQTLAWGNVQNPNSFQPTQTFSVFTYNRGWGVQKSTGNIFLQMTQTSTFSSFLAVPSIQKNNQRISIGLTINFPTNSPAPSTLTIIFPSDLDISSSTCNITCIKISNNITFQIASWVSSLQVTINNVLNAPSFKPIGDFIVLLINNNNYQSLYQTRSSWTNNLASSFITDVSTGDAYRNQNALFKFKLSQLSAKQTYVIIKFSDLFAALTTAPSGSTLLGPRSVRFDIINQASSDLGMSLQTPMMFGDYTFSAQTYVEVGGISYLISQSVSNVWRHSCFNTVCKRCNSANSSVCIDCYDKSISDFYIFDTSQSTCTRDCTTGFFLTTGNICSPCSGNCLQCANISTNCTSCSAAQSLFLDINYKKCVTTCEDGYYKNTQVQQCLQCSSPCLYCVESATRCTYCPLGRFFLNRDCLTNCPTTKLYIQNTVTRNCDTCVSNCLTCQNTTSTCISCNTTALLFLENKRCVSTCQNNSFPSLVTGECIPCKSPCNICFNDSTVCSTCLSTSSTPIWFKYGCITSAQCPIGNYVNTRNSSCDPCKTQCATCTSLDVCTTCNLNFALYQGSCISTCPNTTYVENRVCMPCTGCLTCSGNYTQCTSCISSQFLYLGKCFTECPNGTYKNTTTKTCQPCTSDCPTCMNTTFCLTCLSTLNLYLGKCLADCPISTFPTISNSMKVCQTCPSQCSECTSMSQCQKCATGFSLQNDTSCVMTCSKGISFNQVCYPCGLHCSNCEQSTQTCLLCESSFYLYDKKCLATCPSNTLSLNGLSCVPCTVKFGENCTTCQFNNCLSCSDGELVNGQCRPCSEGTYTRSSKCAPCPSQCRSCSNQTFCFACSQNYFMQQNYCVNVCPLNKIPNGTACTFCMDSCSVCNLQNSLCSICTSGFYLHQSRCVSSCPDPLVVNLNSTKCVTQSQFYIQYSQSAKIVYFPFSIAAGIMLTIGIIIKCYSKMTHLATLACAVLSVMEIGSWAAFTYVQLFAYVNFHHEALKSFLLMVVGIGIIIMIAIVQAIFYCKYLKEDDMFLRWQRNHWCTDKTFLVLSILLNFKLYRIVHSRLLERDQFSMRLMSLNKLLPFSLLSIISLIICSLPVIVGAGLALYFSIDYDQQFFAALDCVTITSVMGILILLDLRHESTYFVVEFETENLKRQIYEEDSLKFSVNEQVEQKNASKAQLLSNADDEAAGHMAEDSGQKLRGQSDLVTTGFNQTKTMLKKKQQPQQDNDIEQIDINKQQIEFYQQSQDGDQALPTTTKNNLPNQGSQKHLMSQQQQISSQQSYQPPAQKWVKKQFDRHGYLLKTNDLGEVERYDEDGYRIEIDENGRHIRYDEDGNQVEMFMGEYCIKDKDGYYVKDGKRFDKRGFEVRIGEDGEVQLFDKDGFRVEQGQNGEIKLFDQHGFEIVKDQSGEIHRMNQDGYEAFISPTGKITYKDKQGNFIRKTPQGQYQMYDPQDGFRIIKTAEGKIQKYDKLGYRIQKDKWGNIYRYDKQGYRVVLGPGDKITRYDKDGYEIVIGEDGQIKRFNKEGYEVKVDDKGRKRLYDEHGYEAVKDFDGQITFYDQDGYQVVIDEQTREHKRYNSQGLKVVRDENGNVKLFDKRGHEVVELQDGFYEKYDQLGNRIQLDLFGYEVQHKDDGEIVRYDKVGNIVDEELFQEKLQEQEKLQAQGILPKQKLKRFKPQQVIDLQGEYSKMVLQENANVKGQDSGSQDQPKLLQFHDVEDIIEDVNFQQQLTTLRNHEQLNEIVQDNIHLNLDELQSVDYTPQQELKQKQPSVEHIEPQNLELVPVEVIPVDELQQHIQLKSVADISINQRSFQNEGVQPIHHSESQCSELESMDELSPNLGLRTKRGRGQRSEMSFTNGENADTKTEYNHKTVNVQIKHKNQLYDQNEQVESLNEENWAQEAQGNMFYRNYNKDLSNANTNTNMNELIFMQDVDENHDTLSSFVKEKANFSQKHNSVRERESSTRKHGNSRYDKNTIEEMENELFEKELDQGIKERRQFILSNKPNPLVEYAKKVQANKKSLQEKMYLEEVSYDKNKKKRRK